MKSFPYLLAALLCATMAVRTISAQTTACSTATLNGKYVVSGQGDIFTPLLDVLGIIQIGQIDTTTSTVGYLWFDGNGGIVSPTSRPGVGQAAARLFQATNAGVSDTTYTVSADCSSGTIQLTSADGKQTLSYNLDPDDMTTTTGIANEAVALDADPGRDEALQLNLTVDPTGGCGTGGTFTLAGISTSGFSRGTDPLGSKVSSIVETTYLDNANFLGTEKISTNNGFSVDSFTGAYVINSDCTVNLTKNVNGTQVLGAHVIFGAPTHHPTRSIWVWQGDYFSTFSPNKDNAVHWY
jgi:hypothetical protein